MDTTLSETVLSETEYGVLGAIARACDTNPSGEAFADEIGDRETVAGLVTSGLVDPHASTPSGERLYQLTDAGWAVMAESGYVPPWDEDAACSA